MAGGTVAHSSASSVWSMTALKTKKMSKFVLEKPTFFSSTAHLYFS